MKLNQVKNSSPSSLAMQGWVKAQPPLHVSDGWKITSNITLKKQIKNQV